MTFILDSILAAACLALVRTSGVDVTSDIGGYDNGQMMQVLYQHLADLDPSYFSQRDDYVTDDVDNSQRSWQDTEVRSNQRSPVAGGQTDIRDSEYIGHSSNAGSQGFIYMSGGAGEGKQHLTPTGMLENKHQVKSDESLPFYCHPPNPCPKGYSSKDGCQESIEDSAEVQKAWIEKMMQKGLCNCDEEHMFDCPSGSHSDSDDERQTSLRNDALDDVLNKILGDKHDSIDNPYVGGQKRQTLVAKKSPRVKRDLVDDQIEKELEKLKVNKAQSNPFLSGEMLPTAAKKGFATKQDKHY